MDASIKTMPDAAAVRWWNHLEPWRRSLLILGGASLALAGAWAIARHGAAIRFGDTTLALGR